MNDYEVLIRPLITEQGMHLAGTRGAYSFQVNKGANKAQIRTAVQNLYGVKVRKIRTANRKGKFRRRGRNMGMTASWKKAIVYLDPEDHIDLF
jgi:large subunit ribosomal protein L23